MTLKKKIIFILNPISGVIKKSGIPEFIKSYLDKDFFDYAIIESRYSGHAFDIARKAADDGYDFVVAIGGDGTVNEVGRALVHSDTAMGIIPCGSGNGLARHLMLPFNIKKAIEIINCQTIHELDYGKINEHPFFCTCGMGFDAYISMKFAQSGRRGAVTYLENIIKEGLKYKPGKYRITSDEYSSSREAFLISCANASQYGNNAYIAPQASMSDGLLDVIIMEPLDIIDAPQISIDMFNKTINRNHKIKTFKTRHIHIERQTEGVIHYDGDPVMAGKDIDISICQKGIKIVVNPFADKTKRPPNAVQNVFSDIFNAISTVRTDIGKQGKHIQIINKQLLKKLNNL